MPERRANVEKRRKKKKRKEERKKKRKKTFERKIRLAEIARLVLAGIKRSEISSTGEQGLGGKGEVGNDASVSIEGDVPRDSIWRNAARSRVND